MYHDTSSDEPGTPGFRSLDRLACLRMLHGRVVGRVVYTDRALPSAQPVNYVLDGDEVLFRTASTGKIAAATCGAVVAFQVDDIDPVTRTGWSVLGVGEAYEVVDPRRLAEVAALGLDSWAPLAADHVVCIPLQVLTGRELVRTPAASV
ncbi:pyridoxamine 5'-phosphate oxidase family protein [Pseudonocardia hydrocarbonoxydans]|uniref:Pyridoxamine 5'-phosphate oxidase n=1 Tax=Pseudonocardia hydrocarbonoxydans TaxID=76726 RepID=A0A4Y3WWF9_9PSEU|nr:pyridoxamine 5'-phosphate oxidase family protein [Pseudonocardia hydrocarbonoxydans]GEC22430.1 pyridoxamine 5'-phosphate oxidase [Pseudonocardia hydrocarbonoxydans]